MNYAYVFRPLAVATGLAAVLIAGCSGGNGPSYYQPPGTVTVPTPTPVGVTPTPTAAPVASATELFIADPSGGVGEYNAQTGAQIATYGGNGTTTGSVIVGVDDNGNTYEESVTSTGTFIFQEYSAAQALVGTFVPTSTAPAYIGVAPTGEVVISGTTTTSGTTTAQFDEWDPATTASATSFTGAPNRTITNTNTNYITFGLDAAGDLFTSGYNGTNQVFNVYTADTATLTNTIVDTLAPSQTAFVPSSFSIGGNGTLYVGEDAGLTGATTDPDAGVYAYPAALTYTAGEIVAATSASVVSLDTDASSNVYAALNSAYNLETTAAPYYSADNAAAIDEYGASLGTPTNSFSDGLPGVVALTAGGDGTAYLSNLGGGYFSNSASTGSVSIIAPTSTTVTSLLSGTETFSLALLSSGAAYNSYNGLLHKKTFYANVGANRSAHGGFVHFNNRARLRFVPGRAIVHPRR